MRKSALLNSSNFDLCSFSVTKKHLIEFDKVRELISGKKYFQTLTYPMLRTILDVKNVTASFYN